MSNLEQLRNLPSVDEVLRDESLVELHHVHSRRRLTRWVRASVEACRQQILGGHALGDRQADSAMALQWILKHVHDQAAADDGQRLQQVINATGVLLHTNLGRAPLAERAVARMLAAVAFCNVELNLQTGKRSKRGDRAAQLICELVGGEDAVVVNNCAAATMLVLQAIAAGREVIVSRGQLVEIGGGFRLPEVFTAAGVVLREVGTTNRTYVRDYEQSVGPSTGAIIRVHRSNFSQSGFVSEPSIEQLVRVAGPLQVPVIDDVGSGCLYDLSSLGLHEPNVCDSVAAGADVTLFSGDKLLGGPQCGIIVGRRRWIDLIRVSPMMRAMRVDKLTMAALEATLEIHLSGRAFEELPLLRMLSRDPQSLRENCLRVQSRLSSAVAGQVSVSRCESQIGGGTLPGAILESYGLTITAKDLNTLAQRLRTERPAVLARVSDDSLLLDLRTVADHELDDLAAQLQRALSCGSSAS